MHETVNKMRGDIFFRSPQNSGPYLLCNVRTLNLALDCGVAVIVGGMPVWNGFQLIEYSPLESRGFFHSPLEGK